MSGDGVIEAEFEAIDVDKEQPNGNGSRFNAVKHGLSAKTLVLPGEDGEELHDLVDAYKASLGTQNKLQEDLAECAAKAKWQLERAERGSDADHAQHRRAAGGDRAERETGCHPPGIAAFL